LDPRFLAARDLLAAVRFFAVRLAGGRFFVVIARAGRFVVFFVAFARADRLVVFFAEFVRGAAFVRAGRFFFAVRLRGAALAPVVRFFAGAFRARDFVAALFRAGGRRRDRTMAGGASISSNTGAGVPAYSGGSSSAPKARRPARQAPIMIAPNP